MKPPDFTGVSRLNPEKSNFPGLAVSRLAMKIEHDEPLFVQAVKTMYENGNVSLRDHWSLSDDDNELRMEHHDDDIAGQPSVLERVADGA